MADVVIFHASDKETAAARLAEAVAAAGFAVDTARIEDPAGLADSVVGCDSEARILIWSRPLVSHALHSGDLSRIRQLPGLIEVSADGIAPPSRGDEARIVSVSGWRGQPFHPGWQRIHAELKRLCEPRKPVAEARPARPARPALAPSPHPEAADRAPSRDGGRRQARLMLGGGIALLLAAASVGAVSWFGSNPPDPAAGPELREAPASGMAGDARRPASAPAPQSPSPLATVPQAADPPPPPSAGPPATARAGPNLPLAGAAPRPARPKPAARAEARPRAQEPAPKKYSRRNSKVMRQFCERSGRSTPQCRTFLRSIRAGEAE
ncbi:MAG TPA: hypothetical protein VF688_04055 [Allosphingosinicella sp.]|jgi:hypothetical protein